MAHSRELARSYLRTLALNLMPHPARLSKMYRYQRMRAPVFLAAAAMAACAAPPADTPSTMTVETDAAGYCNGILEIEILVDNGWPSRLRRPRQVRWLVGGIEVRSLEAVQTQLQVVKKAIARNKPAQLPLPTVSIIPHSGCFYVDITAIVDLADQLGFAPKIGRDD